MMARSPDEVFVNASKDDREAIESLHLRDEIASRAQDFATLRSLMSSDPAVLAPGAAARRGATVLESMQSSRPGTQTIESYHFDWAEVHVLGDYAFEWGVIEGGSRPSPGVEVIALRYNVMRILKKEDGVWRVHRTIWNNAPALGATR
jgi:ketosteroid isomerase-like protein